MNSTKFFAIISRIIRSLRSKQYPQIVFYEDRYFVPDDVKDNTIII